MKAGEHIFGRGEIIYHEGDPCDAVYVVVSGRVELFRETSDGTVILSRVGPIEMFGETDSLSDGVRESSARALSRTRVKMVPRSEFMVWVQNDPSAGLRVLGLLVERLRMADAIISGNREALYQQGLALGGGVGGGFLERLIQWLHRRRQAAGADRLAQWGGGGGQVFQIGICQVNNDVDGAWTRALAGLLAERVGIAVRELGASIRLDYNADQAQVSAMAVNVRQVMGHEPGLDLLIWGDVHADGYSLWFSPAGAVDEDRPGAFSPYLHLELPGDQEPPAGELFYLCVLASIEPLTDPQRQLQHDLLTSAFQTVPAFPDGLPVAWNLEQQRTALAYYAGAMAAAAPLESDPAWFERAAEVYEAALLRLTDGQHGVEESVLRKHRGGVLMALSDRRQDVSLLDLAVQEYRLSVECLVKAAYPLEWGGAHNRLGQALYKLDLLTGQPALLKEAMSAFQSALQVFTRAEAPLRWSDVMNNLAQVLQVYGDQVKSPEVLERAVDACRAALEFRQRERAPLAWAGCQNTLGTALFLLDKHRQSTSHLDEAAQAYTGALEVYRQMGATRLAAVAEKNLAHVARLNKIRGERRVAMPDWAGD
ncbi:MAG: Crp/Fnr family transcriptional regulator [Telmatospirillum sp.]|nr:Crp/Fnr family transcriptional regulator [Telmatospirillum sp.]